MIMVDPSERTGPMTRNQFHVLAAKVKEDTKYSSNPNDIVEHPAHKEIVADGEAVLKFILQDLEKDAWHWFMALYLITGETVIPEEHHGMVQAMTDDWLAWGRENGYLPNKP